MKTEVTLKRVIGVTGGTGAGKSAVLKILAKEHGVRVIEADKTGHEVLLRGGAAFAPVLERFGSGILGDDGEIDRAKLAAVVFADGKALADLNAIVHPAVRESIAGKIRRSRKSVIAVEAALFFEGGLDSLVTEIWAVTAPLAVREKRLAELRGYDASRIRAMIAKQMTQEEFVSRADIEIENGGDLDALRGKIAAALRVPVSRRTLPCG